MPVAPYGSPTYRAWNNARMRKRRSENAARRRRELDLESIRCVNKTIAKYEELLNPAPGR